MIVRAALESRQIKEASREGGRWTNQRSGCGVGVVSVRGVTFSRLRSHRRNEWVRRVYGL